MEEVIKLFKAQGVDCFIYHMGYAQQVQEKKNKQQEQVRWLKKHLNVDTMLRQEYMFIYLVMRLELNMAKKYKRNKLERKLDEYNHTMELKRLQY